MLTPDETSFLEDSIKEPILSESEGECLLCQIEKEAIDEILAVEYKLSFGG